jgi:membrane protease YdiL (CAAX protease family)
METPNRPGRPLLWAECIVLYVLAPLICWWQGWFIIPVLLVMGGFVFIRLWRDPTFQRAPVTNLRVPPAEWRRMLIEWLIALPLLAGLVWWLNPGELLAFPREQPGFWALIMVAYPVLSVWPQELIYRAYFLHRYRPIFGAGRLLLLSSAAAFGSAHVIFGNPIAVILTLAGGWLFASTYRRTGSLPFVAIQHNLYGCAIFTAGLGEYFYKGTARFLESITHSHPGL